MRTKSGCILGGLLVAAAPLGAHAAILDQFNFGSVSTTGESLATMETPTAAAAGFTVSNLSLGSATGNAEDEGSGAAGYYTSPGPNYLSVDNTLTTTNDDTNFYVDFTLTAPAGETFTPTSFALVGGAGGSSNNRSFMLFDSANGFPTSVTPNPATAAGSGTGLPTVTGGDELGGDSFTALRNTSVPMNDFTLAGFTSADQNLSSLEVRVYFDTQANGQTKNIDLSELTLNGTISAVPEPASIGLCAVSTLGLLRRSRRRIVRD